MVHFVQKTFSLFFSVNFVMIFLVKNVIPHTGLYELKVDIFSITIEFFFQIEMVK